MAQDDFSTASQPEPLAQANASSMERAQGDPNGKIGETGDNGVPFFPVTREVTFKPMAASGGREGWSPPPGVARLVSLVSLGALLLGPLSGCSGLLDNSVPCPVPTPNGTPTTRCTTSSGRHYIWIHNSGGWVPSDDGVHPNVGAHGVGADEGHGGFGGHGGSDGG